MNQEETHLMRHATDALLFAQIGNALRALREKHASRLGATTGREEPTGDPLGVDEYAQALVSALAAHGCTMSIVDYLAMENDDRLPDDPRSFVRALGAALSLPANEMREVLVQVAQVILRDAGGADFAAMCLRHAPNRRESATG